MHEGLKGLSYSRQGDSLALFTALAVLLLDGACVPETRRDESISASAGHKTGTLGPRASLRSNEIEPDLERKDPQAPDQAPRSPGKRSVAAAQCPAEARPPLPTCDDGAYFVDSARGSDSNSGSLSAPWRSLDHARRGAGSGATICVNSGSYGVFSEKAPPRLAKRQVIRAAPGDTPTLTGIDISYGSLVEANLTISGLTVRGRSGRIVNVDTAIGVRLHQLHVSAIESAVSGIGVDGIRIARSKATVVEGTKIDSIHRGMQVFDSVDTEIIGNYIEATAGSGIQYVGGNTGGRIVGNHITGAAYTPYPENPNAIRAPHASIISFRSGDVVLSGNQLHGMGNSSGIMFYKPDAAGGAAEYSNVLLENNVIYDVDNAYAIRVYNLGSNFIVRNNVIFPGVRAGSCDGIFPDARYRYRTAIAVHSVAPNSSGLKLYNNVLVGIVSVDDSVLEEERNNVAWSWAGWRSRSPSGTSRIVTSSRDGCGNHDRIFENGSFFAERVDPRFPGRGVREFRLAKRSVGRKFGNTSVQPMGSIGQVGDDGFIRTGGPCRDSNHHSVGAYEAATKPAPGKAP